MADLVKAGEITVMGRATLVDHTWVATGYVKVRRGMDIRDIELPVRGRTFAEEIEAVNAGLHAGIGWVNREFPTQR
jgi:hypothetical protein